MSSTGSFFSRDELLGGLAPERRASTLLFAIESRTAQVVARARRALLTALTERTAAEQERAFLSAMAGAREAGPTPSVQDLDRYAPRWADLVPEDAQLRAALIRLILTKYAVPAGARRLGAAVGMDDAEVIAAYERLYAERPEARTARRVPMLERLRWFRSRLSDRLERMPPFWIAFALTLTETVAGGILALPIALAGFGPLGAVAALVVFGVVNLLTIAALCEAITRNGHMRYGTAYFGRLVSDYLGRPGLVVLSLALSSLLAVVLLMGLIGFSDVLAGASGLHPAIFAAGLFAVILLVLYRGSLDATIASAIIIGTVNLALLGVISAVALVAGAPRPDPPAAPTVEPQTLALAFGVLLAAYFGHLSAGNAAKVVLARDPGGRSLLWGSVLAMVCVIAVYCVVVSVVFAVLDERALAGYTGTIITPLAEAVGPSIYVLGAIYASLALGLGSLYASLGVLNLGAEALAALAARLGRATPTHPSRLGSASRSVLFMLNAAPLVGVFIVVELLLLSGNASFTGPLAVIGTLAVPVLIGVFPILMVAAARRRGDRLPQSVIGLVGRAPVAAALWVVYVIGLAAHALIWEQPVDRLLALAATIGTIAATVLIVRSGALRPVAVLEVRYEPDEPRTVSLVVHGRPIRPATSDGADGLRVDLPSLAVDDLRVWAHRVTSDDASEGLPARVFVASDGGDGVSADVTLGSDGEATVRLEGRPASIVFSGLPPPGTAARSRP